MRKVVVINSKGGCGKTTIAVNLAGCFAVQGKSVALVDCDTQASSSGWHKARPAAAAPIQLFGTTGRVSAHNRAFDWVIYDTPAGLDDVNLRKFFVQANYVVLPILPSPIDIRAAEQLLLRFSRLRKYLAGNRVHVMTVANRVREDTKAAVKLEAFLAELRLPESKKKLRCVTLLRQSQNYIRGASKGLSIFEFSPAATCYDREQWQPLLEKLR